MKLLYPLVIFDVDSTLVGIEGIDWLAGERHEEIARLTEEAMNGNVPLEQVYETRLNLIRPTEEKIAQLADAYRDALLPGVTEVFEELRRAGAMIHLVSGGVLQAIAPLASMLSVPAHRLHAVRLRFSEGEYSGFVPSPLARSGGKATVVRDIRARAHGRAVLIGDGASDLEARSAVDRFVGFGGVAIRESVRAKADVYVTDRDLRAILPLLIRD